jgi:tetratricopeptide (TPR) repeat protein
VISVLRSAGVEIRAFNEAFRKLKEIQAQLPRSCPEKVQTFGGFVENIVNCYNGNWLLRLSDGTYYSFPPGITYLFGHDQPWAIGELITGLTTGVYYCVSSISPVIVYPSRLVNAAARRKWEDGDREKLLSDRASVRARKNETLDARIAELDRKIEHNSNDAAALVALGTAYLEKGDYAHALEKINMAIALEPGNAALMNHRCWARALANREIREGLNDCNKSLELQANDPNTLDSRGYIYLRLGEYDKAIADFDAGLQNRNTWDTWASSAYGRGLAKRKNGDSAGGNDDIRKALEIKIDIDNTKAFFGFK